ncbi:MAG: NAD(P)-dependent oxidoreductase [Spirosomataceae bacterium]
MVHPFFLLNVSRGEIVDLQAVVRGLRNGKVRGVGLDVLENEKLNSLTSTQQATFDYLRTSNRVILTPHVAGWTKESYIKINEALIKQLQKFVP